jgi:hypothetical protein
MASYEQRLETFQSAHVAPDRTGELACPNCGAMDLRLRFVIFGGREDRRTSPSGASLALTTCRQFPVQSRSAAPPSGTKTWAFRTTGLPRRRDLTRAKGRVCGQRGARDRSDEKI